MLIGGRYCDRTERRQSQPPVWVKPTLVVYSKSEEAEDVLSQLRDTHNVKRAA